MKRVSWIGSTALLLALACFPGFSEGKDGTLSQLVRAGQSTPDNTATFTPSLEILGFNNEGQVAFLSSHAGTTGVALNSRIYVGSPGNLTEIVRTGQFAPDRNGAFSVLNQLPSDPQCRMRFYGGFSLGEFRLVFPNALNNKGQLAFQGTLSGTSSGEKDGTGVFLNHVGSLLQLVRAGQSLPDGSGVFSGFSIPFWNGEEGVGFAASVLGPGGQGRDCRIGLFLAKGTALVQVVISGMPAPNGTVLITGLGGYAFNKGQVAFVGYLSGFSQGQPNGVLYLANGNSLTEIVRAGQPAPDGNGQFLSFSYPVLNDRGEVAFQGVLTGTKGNNQDNTGIFLSKPGRLLQIARSGMPASDGNGTISRFYPPQLNNAGQVAFSASYTGTSGGGSDNTAIFLGAEGSALKLIAQAGPRGPDGNGRLAAVGRPRLNAQGQVAYGVTFIDTRGGSIETGIFLSDGNISAEVVRAGQPSPDGNGRFSVVGPPFLNDLGQIAFNGTLIGTPQDEYNYTGIYIWSPEHRK